MNLSKLFQEQKELDTHIEREHPRQEGEDRLSKKILALQVEIGELAQNWRGFKFWSKDQEPRYERICHACDGEGNFDSPCEPCGYCEGTGIESKPLLEEYIDCLHFILSIGLELGYDEVNFPIFYERQSDNIIEQFNKLFDKTGDFSRYKTTGNYKMILSLFSGLGGMLGFTWKEVEQAYEFKNAINHERQNTGY